MSLLNISLNEVLSKEMVELVYTDEVTLTPGSEYKIEAFISVTGWNGVITDIDITENPNSMYLISWKDYVRETVPKLSFKVGLILTRPEEKLIVWFKNNANTNQNYKIRLQGFAFKRFF